MKPCQYMQFISLVYYRLKKRLIVKAVLLLLFYHYICLQISLDPSFVPIAAKCLASGIDSDNYTLP